MSTNQDQPEAQRHIQAELGRALAGLGLADDGSGASSGHGGSSAALDPYPPGATIGRFSVLQRVGRGGQGDVYAAYDPNLDRRVALKLIRPVHDDPVPNIRLLREAQALAQLDHPNVIRVHEAGTHGSAAYLVMEFKTSQSLARWLVEARRTWREILAKFLAAGRGLRAAHEKGIVHRDVKADNIFVDDHVGAVLGDFGLAFGLDDDSSEDPCTDETSRTLSESRRSSALRQPLTEKGQFPGTEGYIAPEAMAGRATARSDQYSLCVAIFHAMFGVLARPDERRHPPRRGDEVPSDVVKALHRGLARDPNARFPAIADLLAALAAEPRRRRAPIVVTTLLLALGGGWWFWPQTADSCLAQARARAEQIWNPTRRTALADAFAAVDLPFAYVTGQSFLGSADDYTSKWMKARAETCAAPSPAAEACHERQLERFDQLLTTYTTPNNTLMTHALDAAGSLDDPSKCRNPGPYAQADIPDDLRRLIDQADLRIASGDFARAQRLVDALKRVPHDSPAHPRTLYLAGWLAGASKPDRHSDKLLEDAMHAAFRAHDYDTFVRAATYRLKSLVLDLGAPAEAATLDRWVETLASKLAPDTLTDRHFRAEFAESRGMRFDREGDRAAAAAQHQSALELRGALAGPDHPLVSKSHHNLAVTLTYAGDAYDEARHHYIEALRIRRALLGETHPQTIETLFGLAQAECEHFARFAARDREIMSDCVADLTDAVATYQQHDMLDPRGLPRRAVTLANHAIDVGCDTCAESALALTQRALADLPDVDTRESSDLLGVRAKLEDSRGALAEAHASHLAGVQLWERTGEREQSYFQHLHNATDIAIDMHREGPATALLLARGPAMTGFPCAVRQAYAEVLEQTALTLGPARSAGELQQAALAARRGCT